MRNDTDTAEAAEEEPPERLRQLPCGYQRESTHERHQSDCKAYRQVARCTIFLTLPSVSHMRRFNHSQLRKFLGELILL